MKKSKLQINIEKKHVYLVIGLFVFLAGFLFVTAAWDSTKTVWHSGDNVKINISGTYYSLQEAIANELIGKILWVQTGSDVYYNAGNVGIGTTTPDARLNLNGSSAGASIRVDNTAGGGFRLYSYDNNGGTRFRVWDGNTEDTVDKLVIRANGNIGIGTTTPTEKLDVSGNLKVSGTASVGGGTAWHSANDGAGSGLDADTVDGVQASSFYISCNWNGWLYGNPAGEGYRGWFDTDGWEYGTFINAYCSGGRITQMQTWSFSGG